MMWGRSLRAHRARTAKTAVKPGRGDRGDQKRHEEGCEEEVEVNARPARRIHPADDEKVWEVKKGTRTAVLWQRLHPLGLELRLDVNGDMRSTTVEKTVHAAREVSAHMRAVLLQKGWAE
jgi:hypothetical protein